MKKLLGALAAAAVLVAGAAVAQAQPTRANLYNEAGVKLNIVTKNYATSYNLDKSFALKYGADAVGTWTQASTGRGATPFLIALGKNEIVNGRNDLIVHTGSYVIETGACTITRLDSGANNGLVGACAFAPIGTPVAWVKCADENGTCNMGGTTMEVRHGAAGKYVTRSVSSTFQCTNAFFGSDPAPNVVKTCELR